MEKKGSMKISPRKTTRRRSHRRKALQDYIINIAEARREIVNALHLHRSSSSSCSSTPHCSLLMEALPTPQPTWFTTSPSLLPSTPTMDLIHELEWGDNNLASSYTWWLGFLKSLDGRAGRESTCTFGEDLGMESFRVLSKTNNGSNSGEPIQYSSDVDDQTSIPDGWLTIPSAENLDEMDESKENEEF